MNLAAALPLNGAEKKIAPASRTILIGTETYIQREFGTLKTPAAITSFWNSLREYATRNHTASTTTILVGAADTARARTTAAKTTKAAAKPATRKTRGAGG